jgi:hypothetical protein
VCFVRALAQSMDPGSPLSPAEICAIKEDAWLTATKLAPLSYSFYVQGDAYSAADVARLCLAVGGEGKQLLDLGGAAAGGAWAAVACQHNFRSTKTL